MSGIPDIVPYRLPNRHDLPANVATWRVDPARAVLLIHDMQRYFVRYFAAEQRDPLLRNIAALREQCDDDGIPVAFTAQSGDMSTKDRVLLNDFWGAGMTSAPEDRAIVDELGPRPGDWRFTKWRYSAFVRSDLLARMRAACRDQLIICGIYAHVGVLATAVEAFSNDIETFLVADAVADFTLAHHRLALDYAASRCAVVTTTADLPAHRGLFVKDHGMTTGALR